MARWFVVIALGFCTAPAYAAEPAAEFLEALRRAKMHDVALDYLADIPNSNLVTLEFKETLDYQLGLTLIDQSRNERDVAKREQQLDKAQAAFKKFLETRIDHPKTDDCKQQLGNLLVERGRAKIQRAEKSSNKAQLQKEARDLYDEAYRVFATAQNDLKEKLAGMKQLYDPKREQDKIDLKNRLRAEYLQAQLLSAAILEESADTMTDKDPKRAELLQKAFDEYGKVYEKYRTRIAGSYARMYQGRCSQKLGKHKDALSYLTELLEQPDDPQEFRTLKIKSMNYAMDSWVAEGKLAEAISKSTELVKTERPNESRDADWMQLRVSLARATVDYVKQLQKADPKDNQVKVLRSEARKHILPVTKVKSDYQTDARKLAAELQGVDPSSIGDEERPEPKTFAEAKEAGKEALDAISTSQLIIRTLPQRIAREKDANIKAELVKQLEAAKVQIVEAQSVARKYFEQAIHLVKPESNPDDVDVVRYFLCYLLYKDQQFMDSALVGEFVARRSPGSAGARQSAKIALASYIVLYSQNKTDDKSFEADRIKEVADYIIKKWPDQPEAEEAINTIIPFLIQDNKLDEAMAYVERIPEESPRRGDAELKVGQALWSTYLRGLSKLRKEAQAAGSEAPATPPELEEKRVQAKSVLTAGISRMEKAGVSDVLVAAALSLAQISVDSGEAGEAVKIMEHPNYGLVKLAQDRHAATKADGVVEEIFTTALRAYIANLADGGADRATAISQAKAMMTGLKSAVADPKKLVRTYVSLARSLEKQISLADPSKRKELSEVFATFLSEVGSEAEEFSVLNWVAETFRNSLGKSNLGPNNSVTPEAKKYYAEAAKTYEKMLAKSDTPGFLPQANLKTHLQMQVALTKRDLGEFVAAKNAMVALLKDKPMNVSVQVEAAKTYQQWAAFPGKEDLYMTAIMGSERQADKKNLIWGWGKLAKITAGKKQFDNVFHQARVQLATCRYKMALAKPGAEQQTHLNKAKQDIVITHKLYPALGGEAWRAQYDGLLKTIQGKLGERATGLAGLEAPAGDAAKK